MAAVSTWPLCRGPSRPAGVSDNQPLALAIEKLDAEPGQGRLRRPIANAVANATGKRLRDLPLTRKRIKDAIGP